MSISGWRVHSLAAIFHVPREVTFFGEEFSVLFTGLDQRMDDLGVPEGHALPGRRCAATWSPWARRR